MNKQPATGQKGIVSTAHPAATAVASHILQQNGTVFAAAFTAAAKDCLVTPIQPHDLSPRKQND